MTSLDGEIKGLAGLCDFCCAVSRVLEEAGKLTAEEIATKCDIPFSRINMVLNCLKEGGLVVAITHAGKKKRFALRFKDPELSRL